MPDDVLRMAGGEGIARRVRAGGFDDLKVRVEHPWARNAEGQLQKLVADRTERTDQKDIIALPLVNAPEDQQCRRHERDLRAEIGQARKNVSSAPQRPAARSRKKTIPEPPELRYKISIPPNAGFAKHFSLSL